MPLQHSTGFLAANATAVSFAFSAVCGARAAGVFGGMKANVLRLALAFVILGLWLGGSAFAHVDSGSGLVFLFSGVIGFGLGDVALYAALQRLGARLTLLINFCTAPFFAFCAGWLLGGGGLSAGEWASVMVILLGVGMALWGRRAPEGRPIGGLGILWALIAGLGQGVGASFSRLAETVAVHEGIVYSAPSAAFLRIAGGLLVAIPAAWWIRVASGKPAGVAWLWIVGAACFGPVVGVSLYQFALKTVSAPVTLALVALSPVWVIPLAYWLEADKPPPSSVAGALLAVAGVVSLALLSG